MRSARRVNNADGGQSVDDILHRQAGKDDRGDAGEHQGDFFVQLAFCDHGQAQDDAGRYHHGQQRRIACQCAGESGIHDNDRHDGRRPVQHRNGQWVDGEMFAIWLVCYLVAVSLATFSLRAFVALSPPERVKFT